MNSFQVSTKIMTGPADSLLQAMHLKRLLVVTDPFFAKNGSAKRIAQAETIEIFDQVVPDPSLRLVAQGAALVRSFQPDAIAALGGGSAMDCAKAMAYFSSLCPKLIAIPTTSGSGSEVTDFAILTHEGVKHPLVDDKLRPDIAILDAGLLEAMPPSLIADSGFDLISHALEAVAATGASPMSKAMAESAFCTAFSLLPRSFAGDTSVRLEIHSAATMAGIAFSQAGLGICHALAHALGGAFHVAHGRLNAILLPAVIEYNAPAAGRVYAALAKSAAFSGGAEAIAVRSLKNALLRLRKQLQLPESLAQAGIQLEGQIPSIVQAALADPCCRTNPVPATAEGLSRILRQVQGHA